MVTTWRGERWHFTGHLCRDAGASAAGAACVREEDPGYPAQGHRHRPPTTGEPCMKTLKTIKAEMLADAATRAEFDAQAPEFETARELVAARAKAGLSQAQVAEHMGTTQSTVARLESGRHPPSLRTVQRFAQAVGDRAVVRIVALSGSVLPYRPPGRGAAEGLGPGRARGTACCRTQCRPASAGWQTHGRLRSTVCCGYSVD